MKFKCFRRNRLQMLAVFLIAALISVTGFTSDAKAEDVLFFASDVHGDTDELSTLLTDCGGSYEVAGLVGDHGSDTTEALFTEIVSIIEGFGAMPILSQGNHDGIYYTHSTGAVTDLTDNEYYDVYVINWDDFSTANSDLYTYLGSYEDGKVIFVLCHAPLHSTRSNIDQTASVEIFETLQLYGETLDIVYLWGHNHSRSSYDENVDYVALPGETINTASSTGSNLISSVANAELTFTYLNAGYVNAASSATVITVDDSDIGIERFGNSSESAVVERIDGTGTTAVLTSIEITTNPTKMSYSVGSTFNPSGMVITAYYDDGTSKTATGYEYTTTVPESGEIIISYTKGDVTATTTLVVTIVDVSYELAESLEDGEFYIFASYSNGSYYALSSTAYSNNYLTAEKITVEDGLVTSDVGDDLVWLADTFSNGYYLINDSVVLQRQSGPSGYLEASASEGETAYEDWIFADNKLYTISSQSGGGRRRPGGGSTSYYYLYYTGTYFKVTSSSSSASTIYLFKMN